MKTRPIETKITWVSDADEWNKSVHGAPDKQSMIDAIKRWQPFVADALAAAESMDWDEWKSELREAKKPNGQPSEKWCAKYGPILLPENFIIAGRISGHFMVPLGAALLRLYECQPKTLRLP